MSASAIWIHSVGRLGAIVRFSDGAPKPPVRFTRKVRDWERRNGVGRLAAINDPYRIGSPGTFTLHMGDYGANGLIVVRVNTVFTTDSLLTFEVVEEPKPGTALCPSESCGRVELQHVARDEADARAWLERNRFASARVEIVPAPVFANAA